MSESNLPANVIVATYEHRFGTDVRVFTSRARALEWRRDIADVYWHEMIPDTVERPEDLDVVADVYFDHMGMSGGGHAEYFNVYVAALEV